MTNKTERTASTTHGQAQSHGHGNGHGNGHSDDHTPPPTPPPVASFVFAANIGIHGTEPWVSDGTEAGTHLLLDLNPGPDGSGFYFASPFVSGSTTFVPASGGRFVFAASDSAHGNEIWVTNGTTQGTTLLADLDPGPGGSFPYLFAPLDEGLVLFGTTGSRCLVPGFDGAVFSSEWKDALWARFSTAAPQRQRQSVERYNIVKRA